MTKQLSKNRAIFHITVIGIFHLISGLWEGILAVTQGQYFPGSHSLLNIYRQYLGMLALLTIILGILLLFKVNFARVLAISLAWWNLFTAPVFLIWWNIYAIVIKKFLVANLSVSTYLFGFVVMVMIALTRIYIIRMLNVSRAGYIFLNKKNH